MREGVMGIFGCKKPEEDDGYTYYGSKLSIHQKQKAVALGNALDGEGRALFRRLVLKGVFDTIEAGDEQAISRHNEAVALLADIGVLEKSNIEKLINSLINLRYKGDVK